MTRDPRLFVSFSTKDRDAARMLFSALALQHLEVWDYTRDGEQLPLARPVEESLAARIAGCDYFLAVVSGSSTDAALGRYTDFEVRSALGAGLARRGRLLPVLLMTNPPAAWRGAYLELEGLLRVELDPSDQGQFDDAIRRICEYLAAPYVAPILDDPRVFFSQRIRREMNSLSATSSEYVDLMEVVVRCAESVARGEWEKAEALISLFLTLSAFKLPGASFYYPLIIRGVCELQSGRFEAAERTFARAAEHPLRDENSFGGLGHAYFYQRRYDEALAAFRQAQALRPADESIEFNILGTLLHAGGPAAAHDLPETLARLALSPADLFRVNKMKAIALIQQGEYEEALAVFESMAGAAQLDDASAIYYARALEASGRTGDAIALLRRESARLDDLNLYHHLADVYLSAGMVREGLRVYEDKLCRPGSRTRQYLVEHARNLKALGGPANEPRARAICEQVLDLRGFGDSPPTAHDFYYMGFANYLLGNEELARYDYERSGRLFPYYDQFV